MQVTYTGSVTGTGAALDVTKLGFRPRYVKLWNVASGGLCTLEWIDQMADASGFKELNHDDTQRSVLTSNGITPLSNGFTIGADTDLNVDGEVIHFMAHD